MLFPLDGFDGDRAAGASSIPGTGSAWTASAPAALHPSVCVPAGQVSAAAPLGGIPQIHRGPHGRVLHR